MPHQTFKDYFEAHMRARTGQPELQNDKSAAGDSNYKTEFMRRVGGDSDKLERRWLPGVIFPQKNTNWPNILRAFGLKEGSEQWQREHKELQRLQWLHLRRKAPIDDMPSALGDEPDHSPGRDGTDTEEDCADEEDDQVDSTRFHVGWRRAHQRAKAALADPAASPLLRELRAVVSAHHPVPGSSLQRGELSAFIRDARTRTVEKLSPWTRMNKALQQVRRKEQDAGKPLAMNDAMACRHAATQVFVLALYHQIVTDYAEAELVAPKRFHARTNSLVKAAVCLEHLLGDDLDFELRHFHNGPQDTDAGQTRPKGYLDENDLPGVLPGQMSDITSMEVDQLADRYRAYIINLLDMASAASLKTQATPRNSVPSDRELRTALRAAHQEDIANIRFAVRLAHPYAAQMLVVTPALAKVGVPCMTFDANQAAPDGFISTAEPVSDEEWDESAEELVRRFVTLRDAIGSQFTGPDGA